MSSSKKRLKEDLEVAKRVKEAWKEIEEGKGKSYSPEEFFKELKRLKDVQ